MPVEKDGFEANAGVMILAATNRPKILLIGRLWLIVPTESGGKSFSTCMYNISISEIRGHIATLLAGQAAQEIALGEISCGAMMIFKKRPI